MNRKLVLATLLVALVAVSAGCSAIFGGVSDDQLDQQPPGGEYEWDTDAQATIWVRGTTFKAVYDLNGSETIKLYRRGISDRNPLGGVRAVRYRYPNGTVVNGSAVQVSQNNNVVKITVPDPNGSVAFTADASRKRFALPRFVDGDHEVILPPGMRVSNFVFGNVAPGGFSKTIEDDRVHLYWEADSLNSAISVRYYLQRDLYIFAALALLLGLIGGGGILYYKRQIKSLEELRKEYGLDVDTDDEFDDEPPPGMG